jgi:hypothetical protein
MEPWQRFDTTHYLHIARVGYRPDEPVFSVRPPLYPLMIRWLGTLLRGGHRYLVAALLVSSAAALGYFVLFALLARDTLGHREGSWALLYLSAYPWAFFLLAGYAESLFLALSALAFLASRRQRWWLAGTCAACAALTRVQGTALVLPLLFEALRQRRFRLRPLPLEVFWTLLPGLAAAGFLVWRSVTGFPPMQMVWSVHFHDYAAPPWKSLTYAAQVLCSRTAHIADYLDFGAALLFLALTVIAWRELPTVYALYMTGVWLLSLSHVRAPHPLASAGQYMLTSFPAFFLLGRTGSRSAWWNRLIFYPSLALLLFLSANFFLWGWSG